MDKSLIEESLKIAGPSWPLQNTVAVNPLWFFREKHFDEAATELEPVLHVSLFRDLKDYLQDIETGMIDSDSLSEAILQSKRRWPEIPEGRDWIFDKVPENSAPTLSFAEFFEPLRNWGALVVTEVGKFSAAYLDDRQALARFPWSRESFLRAWLESQKLDSTMKILGARNFSKVMQSLNGLSADKAIEEMLSKMGLVKPALRLLYLERLTATVLGWMSQFKYLEWQRSLGYPVRSKALPQDLLAVRMAYDFGLFNEAPTNEVEQWLYCLGESRPDVERIKRLYIFQLASELSYQKKLSAQLSMRGREEELKSSVQMAFCIDVRSEKLRFFIEEKNANYQTLGFSGFFGIPLDYERLGEKQPGHRLPVLLSPAFSVKECALPKGKKLVATRTAIAEVYSYFRYLRKNPLSSFVYVELFGALYIEKMVRRSFLSLLAKFKGRKTPRRFDPRGAGPSQKEIKTPEGLPIDLEARTDRAEFVLRHMGLAESRAPLVVFVGHGSLTSNNAFGSALDCGACGGHSGDINARFLADLLNDSALRKKLAERGLGLHPETFFLAAVHETVTDEVYLLESEKVPARLNSLVLKLKSDLKQASQKTSLERSRLSPMMDPSPERRSRNWSELRPEWGLAGNASFIVAPRSRTRGINLLSRSFLHDYDAGQDKKQNFQTLELIMTAPMIVAQWINFQYYASTVAPEVFGAGDKLLHNLVNESRVTEGSGGDLRIGLPLQSIHDSQKFVHEALRLSVYIEAPQEEIERVIAKHETVRQLVENDWLHLLHIETTTGQITRRQAGGLY